MWHYFFAFHDYDSLVAWCCNNITYSALNNSYRNTVQSIYNVWSISIQSFIVMSKSNILMSFWKTMCLYLIYDMVIYCVRMGIWSINDLTIVSQFCLCEFVVTCQDEYGNNFTHTYCVCMHVRFLMIEHILYTWDKPVAIRVS